MSDRPFRRVLQAPRHAHPRRGKDHEAPNAYVVFNDAQKVTGFNWGGFKGAVVAHSGTDLAFDKLQSTSITNQTASVDDMASKIAQFLVDTFAVKTNADGLRQQINSAFNSLDKKENSGWFSRTTPTGSTRSCRRSTSLSRLMFWCMRKPRVLLPRNADETYCTHRNATALHIPPDEISLTTFR
ncbi:hypothetical protein LXA43DRAFT_1056514 [Ganoderma leucocontextum]|nr:hypothetical protein LXA43DRAFT_1056514 [Ganoderma leucocontextum]